MLGHHKGHHTSWEAWEAKNDISIYQKISLKPLATTKQCKSPAFGQRSQRGQCPIEHGEELPSKYMNKQMNIRPSHPPRAPTPPHASAPRVSWLQHPKPPAPRPLAPISGLPAPLPRPPASFGSAALIFKYYLAHKKRGTLSPKVFIFKYG